MATSGVSLFAAILLAVSPTPGTFPLPVSGHVHTLDGTPLPGAAVRWVPGPDAEAAPPPGSTSSDTSGAWQLELPAEDSRILEASAPGFHAARATWTGLPVDLVLLRSSAVVGTVTSLVPGVPMTGAEVQVSRPEDGAVLRRQRVHAGKPFALEGLHAERVVITARADGFLPSSRTLDLGPDAVDTGTIELDPGTRLSVVLVAAEDARPLAGARVKLVDPALERPWLSSVVGEVAVADAAGRVLLQGLRPGSRTLLVDEVTRPSGYSVPLEVAPGLQDMGSLAVPAAARLSGRVTGASGAPRPGLTVVLRDRAGSGQRPLYAPDDLAPQRTVPAELTAQADEDGRYSLERLPTGEHEIVVSAGGILACEPVTLEPGREASVDIEVEGTRLLGRLEWGYGFSNATVSLLEVSRRSPLVDYYEDVDRSIAAVRVGKERRNGVRPQNYRTEADEHGAFVLEAVKPGTYFLLARAAGRIVSEPVVVEAPDEQEIEIRTSAKNFLHGQVVNAIDEPVPFSLLTVERSGRAVFIQADELGRFEAALSLMGEIEIHAAVEGQGRAVARVALESGVAAEPVLLRLVPEAAETEN